MSYLTVAGENSARITVTRSVFLARTREITGQDEARVFLQDARAADPRADHYPYAWRILSAGQELMHCNDGGEPSGSAGRPILNAIMSAGLTNTMVVVTRYFGGKKLGLPGLSEAYHHAAFLALSAAGSARRVPCSRFVLRLEYALLEQVRRLARRYKAEEKEIRFEQSVELVIDLPTEAREEMAAALAALGLTLSPQDG